MKKLLAMTLLVSLMFAIVGALAETLKYGEPLDPFPETVTVRVMREFNPNTWYPEGESQEDNVLTRFYTEKLNIKYEVAWEVERGQMDQQLNLAIASNDLPDVFDANANQIYRMKQAGQIQPITEAWRDYASDKVREIMEVQDMLMFNPVTLDGDIYGEPYPQDFAQYIPLIWVRQDWLDKLGITDLKFETIDDVAALARTFMEAKPDGKDTLGIALDNTLDLTLSGFGHSLIQAVNIFVKQDDGTLMYSDIQPGMKELMIRMNQMYKEGLFDPEFAVKDNVKMGERVANDECGIVFGVYGTGRSVFTNNKQNNSNAEWKCYAIPPQADGSYEVHTKKLTNKWNVVRAGFEYPEVVVKQQNLWYELWQGDYAEYFHGLNLNEYSQAGEDFKYYPPFWFDPPYKNLQQGRVFPTAWDNRDRDSIKSPETRKQYDRSIRYFEQGETTLYTGWSNIQLFYMAFPLIDNVYGVDRVVFDAFSGPVNDTIAYTQPLCDQTRLEWLTKFIVGTADPETQWDEYVNAWMNVGGDQLLQAVNEWMASQT